MRPRRGLSATSSFCIMQVCLRSRCDCWPPSRPACWRELGSILASRRLHSSLHPELGKKLTPSKLRALECWRSTEPARRRAGRTASGVDDTTATRLVDRLEDLGLRPERHSAEGDRRARSWSGRPREGRELVDGVSAQRQQFFADVLELARSRRARPARAADREGRGSRSAPAARSCQWCVDRARARRGARAGRRGRRLAVRFGEVEAVAEFSSASAPARPSACLGPNGAGKTTTIRALTTAVARPKARRIVAGHDASSTTALAVRQSIGYVPQAISIDGALTAYENLGSSTAARWACPRREPARADRRRPSRRCSSRRPSSTGSAGRSRRDAAAPSRSRPALLKQPAVPLPRRADRAGSTRPRAGSSGSGSSSCARRPARPVLVTTHQMEEAERQCDRIAAHEPRHDRHARHAARAAAVASGAAALEDVFTEVTGGQARGRRGSLQMSARAADVHAGFG